MNAGHHIHPPHSASGNLSGAALHLIGPAALVMLAWIGVHLMRPGMPIFPVDDAYITLHNARVLLGHPDANFAVPALVGATSAVHVVLVALLGLVLPLPWAMDTTLWVGVLLYATGICRLAAMAGARPLPALTFTAAAMFAGHTSFRGVPSRWHGPIGAALLAQSLLLAAPALHDLERDTAWTRNELAAVADWSRANLPTDSVVLIHDAGYIAWATPFRLVDVVGLKTPSSIGAHRQLTLPSGGARRGEAIAAIAREANATHLIVLDDWERIFSICAGMIAHGWSAEPMRADGAYKVHRLIRSPETPMSAMKSCVPSTNNRPVPDALE